jgi:restriction system protein
VAIPDYQTVMLPMLQLAADGKDHTLAEAEEALCATFKLSEAERTELLPSGRQRRFHNRIGWGKTYLVKTGLLEANGRGRFRITSRGREVLATKPTRIDLKLLEQFPEYAAFVAPAEEAGTSATAPVVSTSLDAGTPLERLEAAHQELQHQLTRDLLARIMQGTPAFFESLVVDLLVAMKYGGTQQDAGQAVGRSGDGGVDGIIKGDRLGLDVIYLQAKRYSRPVAIAEVREFAGSLEGKKARKGVFITTSSFGESAHDFVRHLERKIVLIDGSELAQLMMEHGVGVTKTQSYVVQKLDLDYFSEDE